MLKHSEILKAATAHLYHPDTNPNGSAYVCLAVVRVFSRDFCHKDIENRHQLEDAVCDTVLEAFGYDQDEGPTVLTDVYSQEKGFYVSRYDADYVEWRDAWVQALITKLEKEGN